MQIDVKFHDEVVTADNDRLGVAQRLYHYSGEDFLETQGFRDFLKVFDFETGDDFYIPTDFLVGRDAAKRAVQLSLTSYDVQQRTFSRKPRAIAYAVAESIELPTL